MSRFNYPVVYDNRGKGRITSSYYPDDRHGVGFCIHCAQQRTFDDGFCNGCGTFYQRIKRREKKGNEEGM